jgi:hypothetical protein
MIMPAAIQTFLQPAAETNMSSYYLAQCIAPLLAQYHQIVLVPLPRSSQDGLEPMPALPLSALAGASPMLLRQAAAASRPLETRTHISTAC